MSGKLLDDMRKEFTSKNPLKQAILLKVSKFEKIFVFEGVDDFPVYDEWLKHNRVYQESGHLISRGKKQIVELYENAIRGNDNEILDNCIFIVDHDYDTFEHNFYNFITLSCYSIENYIVNIRSARSYLMDEFKMDISLHELRQELTSAFESDYNVFNQLAKDLCKPLFVNHNMLGMTKFYERISSVIHIEFGNVKLKDGVALIDYQVDEYSKDAMDLKEAFEQLTYERAIRGKYVFEFFKLWLSSLKTHLTGSIGLKITKDPLMIERRRLACSSPIPKEIERFA